VQHASHQLRTPLAGLLMHLEHDPPEVAAAIERAHHLETTITDLVALRAITGTGHCDPALVAAAAVARWDTPRRRVVLRSDDPGEVAITAPALRQSLDILIDNALRHGDGQVGVTVEPYGDAIVVEVADQGAGFAPDAVPGTGLNLATGIVQRAGGSLLIRRRAPGARVALLLRASPTATTDPPAD
jgi:signal transduction histidine kinase